MNIESGVTLSWKNITVSTQSGKEGVIGCRNRSTDKILIDKVSGLARPGELMAILGSSGAGKSTLMNTLLYRHNKGLQINGEWYVNGITASPQLMTSLCGFVEQ